MKKLLTAALLVISLSSAAQTQTYDLVTFTPPKGWSKSELQNILTYVTTNGAKRTWARVTLVKSTVSKGTPEADYESEWEELAVKPYQVDPKPLEEDTQTINGWKVRTGLCRFLNENDTVSMLVNTFSNGQRCLSILLQSNTTAYGPAIESFLNSLQLPPAAQASETAPQPVPAEPSTPSTPSSGAKADGFQFNTTNFDDGWTSVVKEDWVEATKGSIKVLLHYPREEEKKYYPQYSEHVSTFWNLLVAPRYSNLRNYQSPSHLLSWQPGLFAAGLLTDNATGKDVWVALFSKGKSGWVEVIAPDKKTFVDNFGVDQPELYFDEWDPMLKLFGLNKFAVGENDLAGKWSSGFSSSSAYYNVYTGVYAGAGVYGSSSSFEFNRNKTFVWQIAVGQSGPGTGMKVDKARSTGSWKLLNNWQIWFSEIERKPKTYNAYFSCFKGGRILWLQDQSYGDYSAFGKVSK
jgi:hypothetical protein